jgi:hypothetical protein
MTGTQGALDLGPGIAGGAVAWHGAVRRDVGCARGLEGCLEVTGSQRRIPRIHLMYGSRCGRSAASNGTPQPLGRRRRRIGGP